ncbi:MAG: glycoside hydrolase family 57 protein [Bacillota bacterium]|jgi:1,4-alpha-glucan branching enzyme
MAKGFLSIVLHAHLPFVRHTDTQDCLEQRWLFQGITESYIPLLNSLSRLAESDIPGRITVSLSPPLLEMLQDPLLQERYIRHLEHLIELADKETLRVRGDINLEPLARMYLSKFKQTYLDYVDRFKCNLVQPWAALESEGYVELITSAATHAYLPLMLTDASIRVQVKTGLNAFRRHFGHTPKGFWLPECAYIPHVEPVLKAEGVEYFILETHGLLFSTPRPRFGYHAPVATPNGLLAFARDPDCSKQVWSADEGYPGDPWYREFYRDVGYDLPLDYLGKALPDGTRVPLGIKYYRVTDRKSDYKDFYRPDVAKHRAWEHAGSFMFWRNKEAEYWNEVYGRRPIMVAPYDAELFGHWWYEGPLWLENLIRRMARERQRVKLISPSQYREHYPVNQPAEPAVSGWGYKGYHEVWLEQSNHWIYRHLHHCEMRMARLSEDFKHAKGLAQRALNQAARELMLAQASDWPFIMKAGTVYQYAVNRFVTHIGRFLRLAEQIQTGAVDPVFLKHLEQADTIFPDLDFRVFGPGTVGAASV